MTRHTQRLEELRGAARRAPIAHVLVGMGALLFVAACGSSQGSQDQTAGKAEEGAGTSGGDKKKAEAKSYCDFEKGKHEVSEYDTSGDNKPDVRKVFLPKGEPPNTSLRLICREVDLNADGAKDVVRYYNEEEEPLREKEDRNFDGKIDVITYFEDGEVIRRELDQNADGKIDAKIYFEDGEPVRAERDLDGESTAENWNPNRWEYFRHGRMVRMGTDLNGDGKVDRWDRNDELRERFEKMEEDEGKGGSGEGEGSGEGSEKEADSGEGEGEEGDEASSDDTENSSA